MAKTHAKPPAPRPQSVTGPREVPLRELRPWPENPRTIRPDRLADLIKSLEADREMLVARPLIALPDGTVICGNQRLHAAQKLGWPSLPTVTVDLDRQRARSWALRDNNSYGRWQEPALAELLAEMKGEGVDLALTGFADRDLDLILAGLGGPANPDEAPLPPSEPKSQPSTIYPLGPHRLACGDAADPELLRALFADIKPTLIWTDPPYGVDYHGKTRQRLTIRNDKAEVDELLAGVLQTVTPLLAPGAAFYVCCPAGPQGTTFRTSLTEAGWVHQQTLVWVKNALVLGHADYHYQHEEILYGHLPGSGRVGRGNHPGSRWYGGNDQTTVFMVDRPSRSELHPTVKPTGLIEPMLGNSSRRGEYVFDPFAGSGSTLIACEHSGRRCLAVELDPGYCDVIRQRYAEVHGGH